MLAVVALCLNTHLPRCCQSCGNRVLALKMTYAQKYGLIRCVFVFTIAIG